ncbi:MAG TPA: cyanophycinase [Isosphaeraceae bacterium]|nr:cyanophycinase [Isosphaeraceae bacterium]
MKSIRKFRARRFSGMSWRGKFGLGVAAIVGLTALAAFEFWHRPADRYRETSRFTFSLAGNPVDVDTETRPGFVLEGGGTDIDDSFSWMIDRSGGGDFVVIRTSGTDAYNPYILGMTSPEGRCADSVSTLVFREREASFDPFVIDTLKHAEAVWIAGGDQARHVAFWRNTPVVQAIENLAHRGVPIGGTSSGLAILGEYVYSAETDRASTPHLFSESALRDPCQERITLRKDVLHLPVFEGMLLDPHFLQESRHGRMAAFLSRIVKNGWSGAPRGLGIDARTALLVEPNGRSRVITHPEHPSGSAILFEMADSPEVCESGSALTARGIRLQEFRSGDELDLSAWNGEQAHEARLSVENGLICLDDGPETSPPSAVSLIATSLIATQETTADDGTR